MAEDVHKFQDGREAAINCMPRDARRSADWLEGYDQVHNETRQQRWANIIAGAESIPRPDWWTQ